MSLVQSVLLAIVLSIAMPLLSGTGLVLADTGSFFGTDTGTDTGTNTGAGVDTGTTNHLVTRHLTNRKEGVVIRTLSVRVHDNLLQHVSVPVSLRLQQSPQFLTYGNTIPGDRHSFYSSLMIEHHDNHIVVSGWRAVQIKPGISWREQPLYPEQLQRFFFQEVRITLPHNTMTGGWDVRSLERELERLGVKVKPKPSIPRPTPQLSG